MIVSCEAIAGGYLHIPPILFLYHSFQRVDLSFVRRILILLLGSVECGKVLEAVKEIISTCSQLRLNMYRVRAAGLF